MKKLFFTFLYSLFTAFLFSQQSGSLQGKILSIDSLPASNVSVRLLNTPHGAITNTNGFFSFSSLIPGKYQLEITSIGFMQQVQQVEIIGGKQTITEFRILPTFFNIDEVVVTAEKTEEKLQRVPIAVTSFNSKEISSFRLWNLQEITALVPNLYSAHPGDNRNATSIRGIGTTSYDPAVATYVDGVNQFNLDTYIPQLIDVERIEVLRGPQGTLYGRNAMGGVINVITKKPTNQTSFFAELNAGNYGIQRYTAGVRGAVIPGKLFAGAALQYQSRKGFFKNLYTETDFDRQNVLTGNYYLKYLPTSNWSITVNFKHVKNRNKGAFPLAPNLSTAFEEPYIVNQNAVATMNDDGINASLSVNHYGKAFNFSSQTAYQTNFRFYEKPLDGDFSPLDIITIFNNYGSSFNKVTVWTEEIKFSSPTASETPFKWTAGGFFFASDNPVKQATGFGSQAPLIGIPDSNFSFININKGNNLGLAFFGQASYEFTDKISLTLGLRYDYETKKLGVRGEYLKEPDRPFVVVPDTSAQNSYSAFSPKLGIHFNLTENQLLYASYSRGFRTGGITPLSSDPSQPPLFSYDPEFSNNFEAGWKNTWLKNRLRLNFAAFITSVSQAQVPTLVLPDAITIIQNAGTLLSKGFELEIEAKPLKGLNIQYNLGYTDARYTRLRLSQNGQEINFDDNRQIFTPSSTSLLMAQYAVPLFLHKPVQLVVRGEWIHLGSQFFDLANTIEQRSYSLFNTRFGIVLKKFEFFVWGRNLGQKKYIAYAYDFGAVHLGEPRTYGATLSVHINN